MANIDFLAIFRTEVAEQLKRATDLALQLERATTSNDDTTNLLESLMREFHTIKGAARAIQFEEINAVAHLVEDIYHALMTGKSQIRMPDLTNLTLYALDLVVAFLQGRVDGFEYTGHNEISQYTKAYLNGETVVVDRHSIRANGLHILKGNDARSPLPTEIFSSSFNDFKAASVDTFQKATHKPVITMTSSGSHLTDYEHLTDSLLSMSGELTVAIDSLQDQRLALGSAVRQLDRYERDLGQFMGMMFSNLEERLADIPRERSAEMSKRFRTIMASCSSSINALDQTESRLQFLGENLLDEVTFARLVPLSNLFSGYSLVVRDLAQELGKQCGIRIEGEHTRIDRAVLEAVRVPLIHLLRNSLDHGIETSDQRKSAGKPAEGIISLKAIQLGSRIRITLEDDGQGINFEEIGREVIQRDDTTEELWNSMTPEEHEQFLFLPGFSTVQKVSKTSGRGFGLDIVKTEVEKVNGRVSLAVPQSGIGTRVVLELPLTLSLTNCLMVIGGKSNFFGTQIFAFPINEVSEVRRPNRDQLRTIEGSQYIRVSEQNIPLHNLNQLFELQGLQSEIEQKHLLVIGSGTNQRGLLVEQVLYEQNVVIRPLDTRLGKLRDIEGRALLRDGGIALAVDVNDLLLSIQDSACANSMDYAVNGHGAHKRDTQKSGGKILVVEDSATIREVERHMLEKEGYTVTTAVNGVDAFNKLRNNTFDLIISDIDMPRMNGIDMITKIRSIDKYMTIPIIVVSYKDREKDKIFALDAGANHYVTKSAFDSGEMIDKIEALIGVSA